MFTNHYRVLIFFNSILFFFLFFFSIIRNIHFHRLSIIFKWIWVGKGKNWHKKLNWNPKMKPKECLNVVTQIIHPWIVESWTGDQYFVVIEGARTLLCKMIMPSSIKRFRFFPSLLANLYGKFNLNLDDLMIENYYYLDLYTVNCTCELVYWFIGPDNNKNP